jgi:hypothetical protein
MAGQPRQYCYSWARQQPRGDIVWQLKEHPKNGSLITQMDSSFAEVPERVSGQLVKSTERVKARFDFLASRMVMIEKYETVHNKESQGKSFESSIRVFGTSTNEVKNLE